MPTWVAPIIAVVTAVFSAGVTWGILSYRQKHNENAQTDLVRDLKECVTKLQGVVTEVEVMKVANSRYERQSENHENRISVLEIAVAKHLERTRRKR